MKLENSLEDGPHALLEKMEGEWKGVARTWFQPDIIADESPISGTIRKLMNGRFLMHEYEGSMGGKPLQGLCILGYDLHTCKFQSAWVDSFHMGTGIMFSEGGSEDAISVLGHYSSYDEEPVTWSWRTEITYMQDDTLLLTAYNISPDGVATKASEILYYRK